MNKKNRVFALATGLLVSAIISMPQTMAATEQENCDALSQAQAFEASENYAVAASAYLAILEGYDFVPGEHSHKNTLSASEKSLIGKCAVSCLERGIKKYISEQKGSLRDCPEYQMLPAATQTMIELEPQNQNWTRLHERVQRQHKALASAR